MNAQTIVSTIQQILAPVVMVSACAILVSGLLQRYQAVSDRMRIMSRERFDLLRAGAPEPHLPPTGLDPFTVERLNEIDRQLPDLLRRHKLIHRSVLTVYYAIAVFIVTMFVIALASAVRSSLSATAVLVLFLLGTGILLLALLMTAKEIRVSQRAVEYEVRRTLSLGRGSVAPPEKKPPPP